MSGALEADGRQRTGAVLALVDAVDPLVQTEESFTLSREGAEEASWRQLRAIFST